MHAHIIMPLCGIINGRQQRKLWQTRNKRNVIIIWAINRRKERQWQSKLIQTNGRALGQTMQLSINMYGNMAGI